MSKHQEVDEIELYKKALEIKVEADYDNHNYQCGGYFCTVATTYYEEDEQKKICCRCLLDRYLTLAREELENE